MKKKKTKLPSSFNAFTFQKPSNFVVHDQKDDSTCTAHALTAAHEILINRRLSVDDIYPDYLLTSDGAKPSECVQLLWKQGQRVFKTTKRKQQLDTKEDADIYYKMKFIPIERDLVWIKRKLVLGFPVVIGVSGFSETHSDITLTNRNMDRSQADRKHCIVIVGYDDNDDDEGGGRFKILNSHGLQWGNGGFGTASYGYMINSFIDGFAPVNGISVTTSPLSVSHEKDPPKGKKRKGNF